MVKTILSNIKLRYGRCTPHSPSPSPGIVLQPQSFRLSVRPKQDSHPADGDPASTAKRIGRQVRIHWPSLKPKAPTSILSGVGHANVNANINIHACWVLFMSACKSCAWLHDCAYLLMFDLIPRRVVMEGGGRPAIIVFGSVFKSEATNQ